MSITAPGRVTAPIEETAAALGVTEATLRGWIRRGLVESVRIGKRRLVLLSSLRTLLGEAADAGR